MSPMPPKTATPLDSLPVGRLGIIPLKSCEKLKQGKRLHCELEKRPRPSGKK